MTKQSIMIPLKDYNRYNTILGWFAFAVATIVYLLTLEPTASWWDCGEYISTAFKLQVGHPPGAPTFQFIGRFFSLFAFGNTSHVAMMTNAMSAISSGFTIMFLFWTITMLAKKIMPPENGYSLPKAIAIFGSGLIGALAYTFSDSFWFSAVEGEVYAMSSLVTALTFWAILKWDSVADEKHSLRWLIFIAFIIGLSIGIHLLNLLAIPAIAYVYYFRKYKVTRNGFILVGVLSILILTVIMYVIIPGIVRISGMFELFFVNSIGLPFNSGTIIYFLLIIGLIVWGLKYSSRRKKAVLNTVILSLAFILIGYASFFMLIIRSNAGTPINENNPQDAISLLSYLNREQYGSYPIFYGPYYNAPVVDYKDGSPVYIKDKDKGKYVITDSREGTVPVYDSRFETIFPRMWSNQKSGHIRYYKEYGNVKGEPVAVKKDDGTSETLYKPTFGENLRFFFSYQVSHMYLRYFMWNFAGRQNDIESQGEPENGNWISGINFIDSMRLGSQNDLPISRENPAHNKFYFLPLILGLVGLFYHLNTRRKDAWVVFLLFFMTGFAIVVYLNQYPLQPRERDYAYAGSFYAFAIWIGLGVLGLFSELVKRIKKHELVVAVATAAASLLLVPVIMAAQGWDDHDRSGKYAARDFAFNYLKGCDKNSVLITFGDNDTFPLWYAQEVEGFRTDVRVVNHMLASGHWYVQQMFKKAYDSEPLKFTLHYDQYENGVNNYVPVYVHPSLANKSTELIEAIKFIANEDDRSKLTVGGGRKLSYMPAKKVRLTVDAEKCVRNGIVPPELKDQIVPYIEWEITQSALYKNDLMVLDFLATNNWERSLYVANPSSLLEILGFDQYFHQEGMVYKFIPVPAKNYYKSIGGVNPDKTYDIFMNCNWGNLNDLNVTVDRESYRNSRLPRQNYLRAAETFMQEGQKEKAVALLDRCDQAFPDEKIRFDMMMMPFANIYYDAGEISKGNAIVERLTEIISDNLRYYSTLSSGFADKYYGDDMQLDLRILRGLSQMVKENKQDDLATKIDGVVQLYSN